MTSINAIRINNDTGILLCDEASYWNEEWMIIYTPDKIQSVMNSDLLERHRTALFIGMAGSSLMGEHVMDGMTQLINSYEEKLNRAPAMANKLLSLKHLAQQAFSIATSVKATFLNDFFVSQFGFSIPELITGSYERSGKKIDIKDEDIQKEALKYLTFEGQPADVSHIFKNTLLLAGYSPSEGFRMYFMSTSTPVCEEVAELYVTGGSGTDTTDLVYSQYAAQVPVSCRREGVDIIDATITAFSGLGAAFRLTAGVAPYPNFIVVDGSSPKIFRKVFDCRSQLVSEAVAAFKAGLLTRKAVREIVQEMLFKDSPFPKGQEMLFKKARNRRELDLFLRGFYFGNKYIPHSAPEPGSVK